MPVRQRAALVILLAAAYWAFLFVLTHLPIQVPMPTRWFDKAQHAAAYGGLAVLLCAAWTVFRPPGWGMAALVFTAVAAYGAFDEATQRLVPRRRADIGDWIADIAGAAIGIAIFSAGWLIWSARRRK